MNNKKNKNQSKVMPQNYLPLSIVDSKQEKNEILHESKTEENEECESQTEENEADLSLIYRPKVGKEECFTLIDGEDEKGKKHNCKLKCWMKSEKMKEVKEHIESIQLFKGCLKEIKDDLFNEMHMLDEMKIKKIINIKTSKFNSGGKYIAFLTQIKELEVFDLEKESMHAILTMNEIKKYAFDDESCIATIDIKDKLKVANIEPTRVIYEEKFCENIIEVKYSNSGNLLAIIFFNEILILKKESNYAKIKQIQCNLTVDSISIDYKDEQLAYSCEKGITLYNFKLNQTKVINIESSQSLDPEESNLVHSKFPQKRKIKQLTFSHNANYLASVLNKNYESMIIVWKFEDDSHTYFTFTGHTDSVKSICFNNNSKILISGSKDSTIKVWNIDNRYEECTLINKGASENSKENKISVLSVAFSKDNNNIYSSLKNGLVYNWKMSEEKKEFNKDLNKDYKSSNKDSLIFCNSIAITSNSEFVICGSNDKHLRVFNIEKKTVRLIDSGMPTINAIALDSNNQIIVGGSSNGLLCFFSFKDMKKINNFKVKNKNKINSITFCKKGKLIALGFEKNGISFYIIDEREYNTKNIEGAVKCINFSSDDKFVVCGTSNNSIYTIEVARPENKSCFKGHSGWVISVMYIHDDKQILSGSYDCSIKIWCAIGKNLLHTFKGHTDRIFSVTYDEVNKLIASGSGGEVILWDEANRKKNWEYRSKNDIINNVRFTPNKQLLVCASFKSNLLGLIPDNNNDHFDAKDILDSFRVKTVEDDESTIINSVVFSHDCEMIAYSLKFACIKIYTINSSEKDTIDNLQKSCVNTMDFSRNKIFFAYGTSNFTVYVYKKNEKYKLNFKIEHPQSITSIKFSSNDDFLMSGSLDGTIKFHKLNNNQVFREIIIDKDKSSIQSSIAFEKDGNYIAIGFSSGNAIIMDRKTKKKYNYSEKKNNKILYIKFDLFYKEFILVYRDQTVKIVNYENIDNITIIKSFTLIGSYGSYFKVKVDDSFKLMAVASGDIIYFLSIETGEIDFKIKTCQNEIKDIDFSRDTKMIVSSSTQGETKIWNINAMKKIHQYQVKKSGIISVAINTTGKNVVSGSNDGIIKLWCMEEEKEISRIKGHEDTVIFIGFNSEYIVSGSLDENIKFWNNKLSKSEIKDIKVKKISCMAAKSDFTLFAVGCYNGSVKTITLDNDNYEYNEKKKIYQHNYPVICVSLNEKQNIIISGSFDNNVRIYYINTKIQKRINYHNEPVYSLAISPEGDYIVSGSLEIIVTNMNKYSDQPEPLITSQSYGKVYSLIFIQDNEIYVSATEDCIIRIWNVNKNIAIKTLKEYNNPIYSLAINFETGSIVCGSGVNLLEPLFSTLYQDHILNTKGKILSITLNEKKREIAFIVEKSIQEKNENQIKIFNLQNHTLIDYGKKSSSEIKTLLYSHDAQYLLSGYSNGRVIVDKKYSYGNVSGDGYEIYQFSEEVISAAISHTNLTIAIATNTKLRLWDISTKKNKECEIDDLIKILIFSPTDNYLACAFKNKIKVYCINEVEILKGFDIIASKVNSISFFPEKNDLLYGANRKIFRCRITKNRTKILFEINFENEVASVIVIDNEFFAIGLVNGKIYIYKKDEKKFEKQVHSKRISGLAYDKTKDLIISVSDDGLLKCLNLKDFTESINKKSPELNEVINQAGNKPNRVENKSQNSNESKVIVAISPCWTEFGLINVNEIKRKNDILRKNQNEEISENRTIIETEIVRFIQLKDEKIEFFLIVYDHAKIIYAFGTLNDNTLVCRKLILTNDIKENSDIEEKNDVIISKFYKQNSLIFCPKNLRIAYITTKNQVYLCTLLEIKEQKPKISKKFCSKNQNNQQNESFLFELHEKQQQHIIRKQYCSKNNSNQEIKLISFSHDGYYLYLLYTKISELKKWNIEKKIFNDFDSKKIIYRFQDFINSNDGPYRQYWFLNDGILFSSSKDLSYLSLNSEDNDYTQSFTQDTDNDKYNNNGCCDIISSVLSSDGEIIAILRKNKDIEILESTNLTKSIKILNDNHGANQLLSISDNGKQLAIYLNDKSIKVVDIYEKYDDSRLKGYSQSNAITNSKEFLAVLLYDNSIALFKLKDKKPENLKKIKIITDDEFVLLCFSKDDKLLVASSFNRIYIWELANKKRVFKSNPKNMFISSLEICENNNNIVYVLNDGNKYTIDISTINQDENEYRIEDKDQKLSEYNHSLRVSFKKVHTDDDNFFDFDDTSLTIIESIKKTLTHFPLDFRDKIQNEDSKQSKDSKESKKIISKKNSKNGENIEKKTKMKNSLRYLHRQGIFDVLNALFMISQGFWKKVKAWDAFMSYAKFTPLHIAAYYRKNELLSLLDRKENEKKNRNPAILKDSFGHSPIYYSINQNHQDITDSFLSYLIYVAETDDIQVWFKFECFESIENDFPKIIKNSSVNLCGFVDICILKRSIHPAKGKRKRKYKMSESYDLNKNNFISKNTTNFGNYSLFSSIFKIPSKNGSRLSLKLLSGFAVSSNKKLFSTKLAKYWIKFKWENLKYAFIILSFFLVLNVILLFPLLSENNTFILISLPCFLLSNLFLCFIEALQIYFFRKKLTNYFTPTNIFDLFRILLNIFWTILIVQGMSYRLINWIVILNNVVRGFTSFRSIKKARYFILLILKIIDDSWAFLLMFVYTTIAFGLLRIASNDHPILDTKNLLIDSFGLIASTADYNFEGLSLEYISFVLTVCFNIVLMLNCIISIFGDSYDKFQLDRDYYYYREMIEAIMEVEICYNILLKNNKLKYFHLIIPSFKNHHGKWKGKIHKTYKLIEFKFKEFFKKIESIKTSNKPLELNNSFKRQDIWSDQLKIHFLNELKIILTDKRLIGNQDDNLKELLSEVKSNSNIINSLDKDLKELFSNPKEKVVNKQSLENIHEDSKKLFGVLRNIEESYSVNNCSLEKKIEELTQLYFNLEKNLVNKIKVLEQSLSLISSEKVDNSTANNKFKDLEQLLLILTEKVDNNKFKDLEQLLLILTEKVDNNKSFEKSIMGLRNYLLEAIEESTNRHVLNKITPMFETIQKILFREEYKMPLNNHK